MKPVAAPISWNFAQLSRLQDSPGAHPTLSFSGSQSEQGLRVVSKFDCGTGLVRAPELGLLMGNESDVNQCNFDGIK